MHLTEARHNARACILCNLASDFKQILQEKNEQPFLPLVVQRRASWSQTQAAPHGHFNDVAQHDVLEAFDLLLPHAAVRVDATAAATVASTPQQPEEHRPGNPFWSIFGIACNSTVTCAACGHTSDVKREYLHSLTMAIPPETTTIEDIFFHHWGSEPLDDLCHPCGEEGRRSKRTELVEWPQVLVVALKRWEVISMHPYRREKVHTHVEWIRTRLK